jgi:hypothetical protein
MSSWTLSSLSCLRRSKVHFIYDRQSLLLATGALYQAKGSSWEERAIMQLRGPGTFFTQLIQTGHSSHKDSLGKPISNCSAQQNEVVFSRACRAHGYHPKEDANKNLVELPHSTLVFRKHKFTGPP